MGGGGGAGGNGDDLYGQVEYRPWNLAQLEEEQRRQVAYVEDMLKLKVGPRPASLLYDASICSGSACRAFRTNPGLPAIAALLTLAIHSPIA